MTVMKPNEKNRRNPQLPLTHDVSDRVAKGALTWTLRRLASEAIRELHTVVLEWGPVITECVPQLWH